MTPLYLSPSNESDDDSVTLPTGETVDLPLVTAATMTGAVFSVSHEQVQQTLPDGLTPIQATPHTATLTFLCVEYHRIGRCGAIEPYNEFGILIPAVSELTIQLPYGSAFTRNVGGYVWYLPVTTEPAKILGAEIWGYPTEVGEITHTDNGSHRQTTVTVAGDHLITLEIDRPPAVTQADFATNYTVKDGVLHQARLECTGNLGIWPSHKKMEYTLGDHLRAERLREIGLGDQALFRFAGEVECTMYAGQPL